MRVDNAPRILFKAIFRDIFEKRVQKEKQNILQDTEHLAKISG